MKRARLLRPSLLPVVLAALMICSASTVDTASIRAGIPKGGGTLQDVVGALTSVACPSASWCVAVGRRETANGQTSGPLVETWRPAAWRADALPRSESGADLASVSCAEVGSCVTVGQDASGPYVLTLRAGNWEPTPLPIPANSPQVGLDAVSCQSPSVRAAVGTQVGRGAGAGFSALAYSNNGSGWALDRFPVTGGLGFLNGVSCDGRSRVLDCTAVGMGTSVGPPSGSPPINVNTSEPVPAAAHLLGTLWTDERVPSLSGRLNAVFCGHGTCTAVGVEAGSAGNAEPLAMVETRRGWAKTLASPLSQAIDLSSISCDGSSSLCAAVGFTQAHGKTRAWLGLDVSSNGHWHVQPSGIPTFFSMLRAVSCVSMPDKMTCTAVGVYDAAAYLANAGEFKVTLGHCRQPSTGWDERYPSRTGSAARPARTASVLTDGCAGFLARCAGARRRNPGCAGPLLGSCTGPYVQVRR